MPITVTDNEEGAAGSTITCFLESLRRDAFVMEAFNYEAPALADPEEFQEVFGFLYQQQLRKLFGADILVVAVAEACTNVKTMRHSTPPEVLVALGHPNSGISVQKVNTQAQTPASLTSYILAENPGASILDFALDSLAGDSQSRDDLAERYDLASAMIAPYLVHSVKRAPGRSYKALLSDWHRSVPRLGLLYSCPFLGSSGPELLSFRDAYYSAALSVYLPRGNAGYQEQMDWLEAFHLSFQMGWGSPTLFKLKAEKEIETEKARQMQERATQDERIRGIALEVSTNVQIQANSIRSEIDTLISELAPPEKGLDNIKLEELFATDHREVWKCNGFELKAIHDVLADTDRAKMGALIHYGLLDMLRVDPDNYEGIDTCAEFRQRAEKAIEERAKSPRFKELVSRLHSADEFAFDLMKELVFSFNQPARCVSFYSLAARLLIGDVPEDFTIEIFPNARDQTTFFQLRTEGFVTGGSTLVGLPNRPDDSLPLITRPKFPGLSGLKHRDWFLPFVELVGYQLQKRKPVDKVRVAKVQMFSGDVCEVVCHLEGDRTECIQEVLNLLEKAETVGSGNHGMRIPWMKLWNNRFLQCEVDKPNNRLKFSVGAPV